MPSPLAPWSIMSGLAPRPVACVPPPKPHCCGSHSFVAISIVLLVVLRPLHFRMNFRVRLRVSAQQLASDRAALTVWAVWGVLSAEEDEVF